MKQNIKRYTVTAALPYANGPLHIGHIAGAYLPADVYVRYLRLIKKEVVFICGSDEHGAAITLRAKKEGKNPQDIIDTYHALMRDTFLKLGIEFDVYHRTSDVLHHTTSQEFFKTLYEKGEFEEKTTEQFFDTQFEQFLADRYIKGTCPVCQNPNAYGDQCEKCGSTLNPTDLQNPKSILSGEIPILKATKHWYLPLNRYQDWLEKWILGTKQDEWKNNVFGQCKSWLQGGLQPRAMTRDLDWGVDVPLPDAVGKKLYVWLDAPIGYISATKQLFAELASGKITFANPKLLDKTTTPFPNPQPEDWEKYWKSQENEQDDSALIHFIGKDNIVFHCIIFPAILKAHGGYILPENVPGNSFLNLEGDKISTSRNWAVWVHEFLQDFPDKRDVLRYVLCAILPETRDSEFTWADFKQRNDSELNAIFSNFVHRVLVLTQKYYDGIIPDAVGELDDKIKQTFQEIDETVVRLTQNIETFKFREALGEFLNVARIGNKYLTETEPWKTQKSDPDTTKRVMFASIQIVMKLAILARVFLPDAAEKMAKMLNLTEADIEWEKLRYNSITLAPGHQIQAAEPLFTNIEPSLIEFQIQKLKNQQHNNNMETPTTETESVAPVFAPQKDFVSFDDFQKMDIRIGRVLEAQRVPKADKLLQFVIDTGIDKRIIVSGVAEHYEPETLVGKQVLVLMNLPVRKIRGVESHGMILYAENETGRLFVVNPDVADVNDGAIVG